MFYGQDYVFTIYLSDEGNMIANDLYEVSSEEDLELIDNNLVVTESAIKVIKKFNHFSLTDETHRIELNKLIGNILKASV